MKPTLPEKILPNYLIYDVSSNLIKCSANFLNIHLLCRIEKHYVKGRGGIEHLAEWLRKSIYQKWVIAFL